MVVEAKDERMGRMGGVCLKGEKKNKEEGEEEGGVIAVCKGSKAQRDVLQESPVESLQFKDDNVKGMYG